jgi:hypothetical protein
MAIADSHAPFKPINLRIRIKQTAADVGHKFDCMWENRSGTGKTLFSVTEMNDIAP